MTEEEKTTRRYQLLQASAVLYASPIFTQTAAVHAAIALLAEIEQLEEPVEDQDVSA